MKKAIAAALSISMAASLAACGGSAASSGTAVQSTAASSAGTAASFEATELKYNFPYTASEDFDNVKIDCSADDPIELSLGCSGTYTGTVTGDAIAFAQDVVERATDGKVKIVLYEGGVLGSDTEMMSGMQMGSVDLVQASPSGQVTMIPNLSVLDIGGAFSSMDNCNTILGNFVELIQPDYASQGLQLLNCYGTDWRLLTSNKEYKSLADLQGSSIRVQENPYHIAFWKALGANPTPLAFGEVYLSLQQGMLDAQENPTASIIGVKLYEVQKYLYESDHIPFVSTSVASKALMDRLSDAQRQAVYEFFYANEWYMLEHPTHEDDIAYMESQGMTYIADMPADITAKYPEAAQASIDAMKGVVNADFLSNYVAELNKIEGTNLTA